MRERTLPLLAGLGLIALLTFFFLQARVAEFKDSEYRLGSAVSRIRESNAHIDHQVVQARFGVLGNYDWLTREYRDMQEAVRQLHPVYPRLTDNAVEARELHELLGRLEQLVRSKGDALERFKAVNSILQNSRTYFLREARELINALPVVRISPRQNRGLIAGALHDMVGDLILLNQISEIEVLDRFQELLVRSEGFPAYLEPEFKDRFYGLIRHGRVIVEYTGRVQVLLSQVLDLPLERVARMLQSELQEQYSHLEKRSNIHRYYLYGFSLVLLASIGMLVLQLQKGAAVLQGVNRELESEIAERQEAEKLLREHKQALEQIVEERTGELKQANETLSKDIEKQKLAQRRLLLLTRAIEAVGEGIVVTNGPYPTVDILYANPAFTQLTGYSPEEVAGRNCSFLQGADSDPTVIEVLRDAIKRGKRVRRTILNYRKDGTPFWNDLTVNPIFDENGALTNFVGVQNDITGLKEVQASLVQAKLDAEQASNAKSDFLATMSHEIRTPMNVIVGMGELLDEANLNREQRGYLQTMRRAGDTLLQLIDNILDLTKVESGRLELESVSFDIRELVHDTCAMMAVKAKEKGLDLDADLGPNIPETLEGDPGRLRQVLVNLLGNAIKFTDEGRIHVSVTRDRDWAGKVMLRVAVSDTGVGISVDEQERIFAPFTQADASVTRKYGGTGLGLAISNRLVELLGGGMEVVSEPGRGSTFAFTVCLDLPCEQDQEAECGSVQTSVDLKTLTSEKNFFVSQWSAAEAPEAESLPDAKTVVREETAVGSLSREERKEPFSILLVEDNKDNRLLVKAYLKRTGHLLTMAENGREGLDLVTKGAFDLILMDMQMPVMDGYTATRKIREMEAETGRPRTPIVAFTAHALVGDREKSLAAGCDDHLVKPVRKKDLVAKVNEVLGA